MNLSDIEIEGEEDYRCKLIPRVEFDEVKLFGYELALEFKNRRLPLDQVEKVAKNHHHHHNYPMFTHQ